MTIGGIDIKLWDSSTNDYTNPDLPYNVGSNSLKNAIKDALEGFDDI